MKTFKVRQLALIFSLLFIACQEDSIIESDELDQDMLAASELADEYLKSEKGRFEDSDKSITVLKYSDGKLIFYN